MEIQEPSKCKVYSCAQIEAQVSTGPALQATSTLNKEPDLKLVDPAVMDFVSKVNLTRYRREELLKLKLSKSAQAPPPYQTSQNINRLDIRGQNLESQEEKEKQFEKLRELLPNASTGSFNPNLAELLNNYHRSLLFPQEIPSLRDYNKKSASPRGARRVSWGDQKQTLERQYQLPSYDNKSIFDNITTTTTIKPPRMGVGSLGYQKRPQNQFFRNAKGNPCATERNFFQNNVSDASVSLNETKSSYDGSMDRTRSDKGDHNTSKLTEKTDDSEQYPESEPEWFSWPASRNDVIDLHGFDDDVGEKTDSSAFVNEPDRPSAVDGSNKFAYDEFARSRQQQRQPSPQFHRRTNNYNSQNRFDAHQKNEFFNRYRHNVDSNTSSSFNSSGSYNSGFTPEVAINPFFEMWKRNMAQQETNSRGGMMTIADVENALRHNSYGLQAQQQPMFPNASVPQFFHNASHNRNYNSHALMNQESFNPFNFEQSNGAGPTYEQLQLHTSAIMRNAMLRKQFQKDRNFHK